MKKLDPFFAHTIFRQTCCVLLEKQAFRVHVPPRGSHWLDVDEHFLHVAAIDWSQNGLWPSMWQPLIGRRTSHGGHAGSSSFTLWIMPTRTFSTFNKFGCLVYTTFRQYNGLHFIAISDFKFGCLVYRAFRQYNGLQFLAISELHLDALYHTLVHIVYMQQARVWFTELWATPWALIPCHIKVMPWHFAPCVAIWCLHVTQQRTPGH